MSRKVGVALGPAADSYTGAVPARRPAAQPRPRHDHRSRSPTRQGRQARGCRAGPLSVVPDGSFIGTGAPTALGRGDFGALSAPDVGSLGRRSPSASRRAPRADPPRPETATVLAGRPPRGARPARSRPRTQHPPAGIATAPTDAARRAFGLPPRPWRGRHVRAFRGKRARRGARRHPPGLACAAVGSPMTNTPIRVCPSEV